MLDVCVLAFSDVYNSEQILNAAYNTENDLNFNLENWAGNLRYISLFLPKTSYNVNLYRKEDHFPVKRFG